MKQRKRLISQRHLVLGGKSNGGKAAVPLQLASGSRGAVSGSPDHQHGRTGGKAMFSPLRVVLCVLYFSSIASVSPPWASKLYSLSLAAWFSSFIPHNWSSLKGQEMFPFSSKRRIIQIFPSNLILFICLSPLSVYSSSHFPFWTDQYNPHIHLNIAIWKWVFANFSGKLWCF